MDLAPISLAFLRASLFVALVPLAGLRSQPAKVKAMIGLALAVVLLPACRLLTATGGETGLLRIALPFVGQTLLLAALVAALNEMYAAATSTWSVQTGLSYASVINPAQESESSPLTSLIQLLFLLHFTSLNLHLGLLEAGLGDNLVPVSWETPLLLAALSQGGKELLRDGLAWGLPYIVLLISADVCLAVAAKLYEKFQGSNFSYGLKLLLLLLLLMISLPLWRGEIGSRIASLLSG
jgi:flagellar biosynthetic protein FliR